MIQYLQLKKYNMRIPTNINIYSQLMFGYCLKINRIYSFKGRRMHNDNFIGPFRRCMLSHTHIPTHMLVFRSVITGISKSNFWLHTFNTLLQPVFDQYVSLISCYYYTDVCHWLLNWSYVTKSILILKAIDSA